MKQIKATSKTSSKISSQSKNVYDDGNIPEVDTKNKKSVGAKDVIPDEVPRKDGPGGN